MKFALGIVILMICVLVSLILSSKYVDRRKFYEDFLAFNDRIKTEISFTRATILEIVAGYKDKNSTFYNAISGYYENKELTLKVKWLKDDETEFLREYLNTIGRSGANVELDYVSAIERELQKTVEKERAEEKKYRSLYIKLGFLLGLAGLIILL